MSKSHGKLRTKDILHRCLTLLQDNERLEIYKTGKVDIYTFDGEDAEKEQDFGDLKEVLKYLEKEKYRRLTNE